MPAKPTKPKKTAVLNIDLDLSQIEVTLSKLLEVDDFDIEAQIYSAFDDAVNAAIKRAMKTTDVKSIIDQKVQAAVRKALAK
jgi:hypothetical protein